VKRIEKRLKRSEIEVDLNQYMVYSYVHQGKSLKKILSKNGRIEKQRKHIVSSTNEKYQNSGFSKINSLVVGVDRFVKKILGKMEFSGLHTGNRRQSVSRSK
jgi:hypothetical protein